MYCMQRFDKKVPGIQHPPEQETNKYNDNDIDNDNDNDNDNDMFAGTPYILSSLFFSL